MYRKLQYGALLSVNAADHMQAAPYSIYSFTNFGEDVPSVISISAADLKRSGPV